MTANHARSEYSVDDALRYLDERAEWLRSEWQKGGDFKYMSLREEECRYVASCIRDTRDRVAKANTARTDDPDKYTDIAPGDPVDQL